MEENTQKEDKGNVIVPLIALIKKKRKIIFDSSSLTMRGSVSLLKIIENLF